MSEWTEYADRAAQTSAVSARIAGILTDAVAQRGHASFLASGGKTPAPIYAALAAQTLPWHLIDVTLTDERLGAAPLGLANLTMLDDTLAPALAKGLRRHPLEAGLSLFPAQPDVALLGMGTDGHIASIFPHGAGAVAALAADAPRLVEVTPHPLPPEAPFARISFSLAALITARNILLLVTGDEKKRVLTKTPDVPLPVHRLLAAAGHTEIHWAA